MQPDVVFADETPESMRGQEEILAKWVGELLNKAYPKHLWAIGIQDGLIQIGNLRLSGNWGYVLREEDVVTGKCGRRKIIMAAGELLERYSVSRGSMRENEMDNLQTDAAGNPMVDKS